MSSFNELNKKNLELSNLLLELSKNEKNPVEKEYLLNAAEKIKSNVINELPELSDHFSPEGRRKRHDAIERNFELWDKEAKEIILRKISDPKIREAALNNSKYKKEVLTSILNGPSKQSEAHNSSKFNYEEKIKTIKSETENNFKSVIIKIFILCLFIVSIINIVIGVNNKAILISSILILMLSVPLYFWYKRSKSLTFTEHIFAYIWLLIRRLVTFTGALILIASLVMLLKSDVELVKKIVGALLIPFMAIGLIWVGIYGRKNRYSRPKEDIAFHKENKKRYRWWW